MLRSIRSTRTLCFGRLHLRFNWLVALCVLFAVIGLVRLGLWQLDRAREKIEMQANFENMGRARAAPVETLPVAGREYDSIQLQNRQVLLRGEYLNDRNIFLIYQTFEDQIGYEIVTPFRLAANGDVVMVSRGWTGAASYEEVAAALPPVKGPQELKGQIYVPTEAEAEKTNDIDRIRWPLVIRYLNMDEIEPLFEARVFPYVVRLNENQPGVLVRHWPEVMVNTGQHYSYALQWFAMAIALVLVTLILASNLPALIRERLGPL